MQWTISLEATTGWGERTCTPVYTFRRPTLDLKPEQVGLTLAEAKSLLARLQAQLIRQQADEYATCRRVCPSCYRMQPVKGYQSRVLDTLFGSVHLDSPRWQVCRCRCAWDHPPVFRRWYPGSRCRWAGKPPPPDPHPTLFSTLKKSVQR
jgi:hypothetical protein